MSITWGAVSGWWSPLCVVLGLLYAWVMYRQPLLLTKGLRYGLFALRTLAVSLLALLLLSPLVKTVTRTPQKPLILIAQDNSESVNRFSPPNVAATTVNKLAKLKSELGNNFDVREFNFDKELRDGLSRNFAGKQTDIANVLRQLNERFVNQNVGAIVLATDGLYNRGADPAYEARNIKASIYTVALGDTVPRRDILISNINYNKTAFLGNDFEVEVALNAYQAKGLVTKLTVTEDGRPVAQKDIAVNSPAFNQTVALKLNADKKGIRKFTFSLSPVANELSAANNTETIYVEVLDARQKILLVYDATHPDISVIKQAIESNRNFEVKSVQTSDLQPGQTANYTAVVLYQLQAGSYVKLKPLLQGKIPLWFIGGTQADLQGFNQAQGVVNIGAARSESQEVFAQAQPGFSAFTLSDSTLNKLERFPPLLAPYGSYQTGGGARVLLRQKIGSVVTAYPLLAFNEQDGRKVGVLTGEGLWRWQLAEYRQYGNHNATNELLSQTIQYLTANANRQRFRVYPANNVFDEGDNILLNAELYNDALELVNTPDVKLSLNDTRGKNYSFLFTRAGQSYQLNAGALPAGTYTYNAVTQLGGQQFKANGQLVVKPLNLETRQSAADHRLLRQMASRAGGKLLYPAQLNELAGLIKKDENIKTVVYEDKRYHDLVDMRWLFVLVLILISTEWFLRKRAGEI
ncbi:hypothetical protein CKK33_08525 [Mucilaginibacter sp. MD40]|uniref:VWA domain-containing protein n=1 Tax=Mucilaginibacter sp. MD40 TaxID=2029590 RepID=UPI000BACD7A7|nr:VWA domain-containing protein [Mucilaginibacter sp. MD40]PAW93534.1 hypothetical protein CKK33_08525 [Mucilaginibacter sp. MD40]